MEILNSVFTIFVRAGIHHV